MKYIKTYEWFNPFKKKDKVTQEDMEYILQKMIHHLEDNDLEFDFNDIEPKIDGNEIDCSEVRGGVACGFNIIVESINKYKLEIAYLHNFKIIDKDFKKIEDCIDYATDMGYGLHPTKHTSFEWLSRTKWKHKWESKNESFTTNDLADKLLEDTKIKCEKHGVKFVTTDTDHVQYPVGNVPVSGYFVDYGKPELGVAIGRPVEVWSATLAHESSHMDQWLEKSKYWTGNYIDGKEAVDYLDEWISGTEYTTEEIDTYVKAAIGVEWDCERRTVQKIKEYNLPLDPIEETQKANSYILFYTLLKETRKWNKPGKAPYLIKEVWSHMPKTFDMDYSVVPENLKELYLKYCFV